MGASLLALAKSIYYELLSRPFVHQNLKNFTSYNFVDITNKRNAGLKIA